MTFAQNAARLAGMTGAALGWPPDQFWRATPAELMGVLNALAPPVPVTADRATLARLIAEDDDG